MSGVLLVSTCLASVYLVTRWTWRRGWRPLDRVSGSTCQSELYKIRLIFIVTAWEPKTFLLVINLKKEKRQRFCTIKDKANKQRNKFKKATCLPYSCVPKSSGSVVSGFREPLAKKTEESGWHLQLRGHLDCCSLNSQSMDRSCFQSFWFAESSSFLLIN